MVGAGALGLLVVAFHTGVELVTQDLPRGTFAARWLAEVGLTRRLSPACSTHGHGHAGTRSLQR